MRKIIRGMIALVLATGVIVGCVNTNVMADIGELPAPGGAITPGDKNDAVQMKSEDVKFVVKKNTGVFPVGEASYYAHVTANFVMYNLTDQAVTKQLFFPFHSGTGGEMNAQPNQTKNVTVAVGGQASAVSYRDGMFTNQNNGISSGVFSAIFAPKAETPISVTYDLRGVNEAKRSEITFSYMMETGSHWAGKIGSGKVTFDFESNVDSLTPFANAAEIGKLFKAQGGDLVWEFKDLEPTAAQNIKVTYDPANLATWNSRPSYVAGLQTSRATSGMFRGENVRTGNDYPGGYDSGQPISVLDEQKTEGGWLIEQAAASFDEWMEFTFDGEYEFDSLQIRTGYLGTSYNEVTNQTASFYDTYRRPKTMVIKYGDGSEQTVNLADKPADFQTVDLPNKATKTIKLSFKDAYDGVGGGKQGFGVGRVKFVGANKVLAVSAPSGDVASAQSSQISPYVLYGAIAAGVLLLGAAVLLVRRARRRRANRLLPHDPLATGLGSQGGMSSPVTGDQALQSVDNSRGGDKNVKK